MANFLGLDAGGTKTYCLIANDQGAVLGFGAAGTGNYEVHGVEHAASENRKAVDAALASAGLSLSDITAVGMGVAGADLPEDYEMLEREVYTPLFGTLPRIFRNDSMAGLRGGLREPFGVVIACGTGCVCAGRNRQGGEDRVGGLGDEFGDLASGSSIGHDGIRTIWRARDGIVPATSMTRAFVERAGSGDVEELFYKLYRKDLEYKALEPMAQIVFDAAFEGDRAACDILEHHGRYLGQMVTACATRLQMNTEPFDVVTTGSVFKGRSPVLMDAMMTMIHRSCPGARVVRAAFEPVVGALLLGLEYEAPVSDELYIRLAAELEQAEERFGVAFRPR